MKFISALIFALFLAAAVAAATPNQKFTLKSSPVTYISASTPSGACRQLSSVAGRSRRGGIYCFMVVVAFFMVVLARASRRVEAGRAGRPPQS